MTLKRSRGKRLSKNVSSHELSTNVAKLDFTFSYNRATKMTAHVNVAHFQAVHRIVRVENGRFVVLKNRNRFVTVGVR